MSGLLSPFFPEQTETYVYEYCCYSDISERFKISERIFPSKAYAKKFCGPDAYNPYSGITIEKLIVDKSNMINSIKNLI